MRQRARPATPASRASLRPQSVARQRQTSRDRDAAGRAGATPRCLPLRWQRRKRRAHVGGGTACRRLRTARRLCAAPPSCPRGAQAAPAARRRASAATEAEQRAQREQAGGAATRTRRAAHRMRAAASRRGARAASSGSGHASRLDANAGRAQFGARLGSRRCPPIDDVWRARVAPRRSSAGTYGTHIRISASCGTAKPILR
jgi:hypothetical protein